MSKWYQEPTREDDDYHFSSSSRVSHVFTGTNRTSYRERERIENEERLAMKRGDMLSPLPKRVANPRFRDDRALREIFSNSDKMHRATSDDAYTQAWFDYSRSVFPQSVRKTGTDVELFNVPTYHSSILFNIMGSFNRKSEFWRPENLNKPITKGKKFNIAELSLLRNFWGNNYAHVILTSEADSLPTDARQLFEDCGLVECHSTRSNDLSVHARIDSTGYVRLLWESSEEDYKCTHAVIFQMKFGTKAEEAITFSRERTTDALFFTDLESVALAIEGSDLNTTEDNFVPAAKCIQETKGKTTGDQIRSSETTLLCMPSPPRAGNDGTLSCSTVFRNSTSASAPHQGRCHCWRCQ